MVLVRVTVTMVQHHVDSEEVQLEAKAEVVVEVWKMWEAMVELVQVTVEAEVRALVEEEDLAGMEEEEELLEDTEEEVVTEEVELVVKAMEEEVAMAEEEEVVVVTGEDLVARAVEGGAEVALV